jgi:formylglycine-generating enzyme required for sulfatase activity
VTTGDCSDGVFDALGWSVCNAVDPQPVGGKAENPWGLYDMAGNVFEWVWDYHGPYDSAPVVDPEASSPDSSRALRGGAVYNDSRALRAAYRNLAAESHLEPMRGFRVARMLVPPGG